MEKRWVEEGSNEASLIKNGPQAALANRDVLAKVARHGLMGTVLLVGCLVRAEEVGYVGVPYFFGFGIWIFFFLCGNDKGANGAEGT